MPLRPPRSTASHGRCALPRSGVERLRGSGCSCSTTSRAADAGILAVCPCAPGGSRCSVPSAAVSRTALAGAREQGSSRTSSVSPRPSSPSRPSSSRAPEPCSSPAGSASAADAAEHRAGRPRLGVPGPEARSRPVIERVAWPILAAAPDETAGLGLLAEHEPRRRALRACADTCAPYHRRGELRCRWAEGEARGRAGDGPALDHLNGSAWRSVAQMADDEQRRSTHVRAATCDGAGVRAGPAPPSVATGGPRCDPPRSPPPSWRSLRPCCC